MPEHEYLHTQTAVRARSPPRPRCSTLGILRIANVGVEIPPHPAAAMGQQRSAWGPAGPAAAARLGLQEQGCSQQPSTGNVAYALDKACTRPRLHTQGLHSSIYKQVLCLWFAAGPLNSSLRANPPSHVAQSTSSISHFFLSLHSSQLLLRLWIPWRKRGNNFLQGHRVCSSLRKQKNGVGC